VLSNTQPIEKQKLQNSATLDVHSLFYTIQGEGPFAGHPAVFVRLAGCNLQCPMCDTDYTSERCTIDAHALAAKCYHLAGGPSGPASRSLVVITGGEPFRQNIREFVTHLLNEGYLVQIETNGTLYQDLPWCEDLTIVCSPKTGAINKHLLPHINAFKYVLDAGSVSPFDGLPLEALGHPNPSRVARPPVNFPGTIYLQPIDDHGETFMIEHLTACVKSCMTHGYTLGIQLHKLIDLP
jgi:organic radical activating enzyme